MLIYRQDKKPIIEIISGDVVSFRNGTYVVTNLWWDGGSENSISLYKSSKHNRRLIVNLDTGETKGLFESDLVLPLNAELIIK